MEHFIEAQGPNIKEWIRERHPKTAEEAANLQMDYLDAHPSQPSYKPRTRATRPDTSRPSYGFSRSKTK